MGGAVLLSSATDLGGSGVFVAIAFAMLVYGVPRAFPTKTVGIDISDKRSQVGGGLWVNL